MTNRKTPSDDREERDEGPGVPSEATVHPDGPLFASGQAEAAGVRDSSSSYPWDEPGEPGSGAEGRSEADPHDELPKSVKIFEPAGDQSEAAGEAPPSALERLNENIEQLFETVDAVAADVAESRSHLERKTRQCFGGFGGREWGRRNRGAYQGSHRGFPPMDRGGSLPPAMVADRSGGNRRARGAAPRHPR